MLDTLRLRLTSVTRRGGRRRRPGARVVAAVLSRTGDRAGSRERNTLTWRRSPRSTRHH